MSFSNMIAEQRGCVSNYSALLARTHLREAWKDIRNMRGWSFQLCSGGFGTPGKISIGSVTVGIGGITVTCDAQASAALSTASTPISLVTQRQFRIGAGTIYNIVAADFTTNPTAATLTLDRPYTDTATGAGLGYTVYQCYCAAPVADFEAWESVLDTNNVIWLNTDPGKAVRERIDIDDAQRQVFSNPFNLIPYGQDMRANSSTLGYAMYELYPQPQSQYSYATWYTRLGPDLVNPQDTLPYPITEHVVKTLARVKGYEWAEANKDAANPRGAGADFRFLMSAAEAQAKEQIKELRQLDRDRVDLWRSTMLRIAGRGPVATFNPATGAVMSRNM